jgi:hypothetical protein
MPSYPSASDTTRERMTRSLFASRVIQETATRNGLINSVYRDSGPGILTKVHDTLIDSEVGALYTSEAERQSYINSVNAYSHTHSIGNINPILTDVFFETFGSSANDFQSDHIINAIAEDPSGNGDIYIGGQFSNISNVEHTKNVAKWNKNTKVWGSVGQGVSDGAVNAIAIDSYGNVYVGGYFTSAVNTDGSSVEYTNSIAKWNGTAWESLGQGISQDFGNSSIYAIAIADTNIYIGGLFLSLVNTDGSTTGSACISKWNGTVWESLGSGANSYVLAIAIHGTDVYIGGAFSAVSNIDNPNVEFTYGIAKWNGSTWQSLGGGTNGTVRALALSGSNLYVAGLFTVALNLNGIPVPFTNGVAKWNGTSWESLGRSVNLSAYAIAVSNSNIYLGGLFRFATNIDNSKIYSNYITKWNGTNWESLRSGLNGQVNALLVSGSNILIGGNFDYAGNNAYEDFLANKIVQISTTYVSPPLQIPSPPINLSSIPFEFNILNTYDPTGYRVTINFTEGNNNEFPILNYEYSLAEMGQFTEFDPPTGSITSIELQNLDDNRAYTIQLRALNEKGGSIPAQYTFIIPSVSLLYENTPITDTLSFITSGAAQTILTIPSKYALVHVFGQMTAGTSSGLELRYDWGYDISPYPFTPALNTSLRNLEIVSPFSSGEDTDNDTIDNETLASIDSAFDGIDLTDKAVLIQRGITEFSYKVLKASQAGAKLVIVYNRNDVGNETSTMSFGSYGMSVSCPVVSIGNAMGQRLVKQVRGLLENASTTLYAKYVIGTNIPYDDDLFYIYTNTSNEPGPV